MKSTRVVNAGVILVCVVGGCFGQVYTEKPGPDEDWPHAEKAQHVDLDAKLRSLAGKDAVFCGHAAVRDDFKGPNDCALKAFRDKKAFYVAYDTTGFDSVTSYGLARNSTGKMYFVDFDSMGISVEGPEKELSDNSHLLTKPCPTPFQLLEAPFYRRRAWQAHSPLTCFRSIHDKMPLHP